MGSGIRSSVDRARLAVAASRPGIDPRVWLTKAIVTDVVYDRQHGLFADVQFQPDGDIETALVGADYTGNDFGEYWPIAVDDIVLVAMPMGDPGEGPIIIRKLFSGSEKPPVELSDGDTGGEEPTKNPTLRLEDGTTMRIVGKNDAGYKIELDGGSTFEISATGGSKVVISADTTVEITGTASVTIDSNATINLGANAALGVARLNDGILATAESVPPLLGLIPWSSAVIAALAAVPVPAVVPPLDPRIGNIIEASTKVKAE